MDEKNNKTEADLRKQLEKLSQQDLIERILQKDLRTDSISQSQSSSSSGPTARNAEPKNGRRKARKKHKKTSDITQYSKRHVAFKVSYVGTNYHGFASQPGIENTIEHILFDAFKHTFLIADSQTCRFQRCGRTDKGVSALGNVVSLDVRSNLSEGLSVVPSTHPQKKPTSTSELDYLKMLNTSLPKDIRILSWEPVPDDFSARFNCSRRTYKYFFYKDKLDLDTMREAASKFVGEHDFRNFCKMDVVNVANFKRMIFSFEVNKCARQSTDNCDTMYEMEICGTAFLWHQIRCMVAILFLVGRGSETPDIIDFMIDIEKCPGKPSYEMAPDLPLVFYKVVYPGVQFKTDSEDHQIRIFRDIHHQWRQKAMEARMFETFWCHCLPEQSPIPSNESVSSQKEASSSTASSSKSQMSVRKKGVTKGKSMEDLIGHQLTRHTRNQELHTPLKKRRFNDSMEEKKRKLSGPKRKRLEEVEKVRNEYAKKQKENEIASTAKSEKKHV